VPLRAAGSPGEAGLFLSKAAPIFGVTDRTMRWWAATGRIRTIKIGQKRFVVDTELQRLLTGGALPDAAQDHE
jgi:hypothetical protein